MHLTGKVSNLNTLKNGKSDEVIHLTKKSFNTLVNMINDNADELIKVEKDLLEIKEELITLQKDLAVFKTMKPLLDQYALEQAEKKAAELAKQLRKN